MAKNAKTEKKGIMQRFVESKFMQFLQKVGQKVGANKGVSSITAAMMNMMGIIMVGAIFTIIASVPTSFGWFGLTTESTYYKILILPYNMTMGLISVFLVTLIGYNFGRALKLKPLNTATGSLVVFLLVAAPVTAYTLYSGTDDAGKVITSALSGMSVSYLGSTGMFLSIIVGLCVPGIYKFCDHFHITIKMPDAVPQFLTDGFSSIIPLLFSVIIFGGIDALLRLYTPGINLANFTMVFFKVCFGWLDSLPGIFILSIVAMLLWFFGIHGTMIVYVILMTSLTAAVTNNYMAHMGVEGYTLTFSYVFLFSTLLTCGGSGNTLPLVLMCMFSKSKQLKAVGRASIVPGLFGVNEPMTFGVPLMYNPLMFFPFVLNPMLCMLAVWGGYAIGFFQIPYVMIGSLMPIGVGEFLGSLAWQNIFIPVVAFIIAGLCYFPFFKAYEKKLVAQEAEAEKAEALEAQAAQPKEVK